MKPALALLVLYSLVIRGEAQDCHTCLALNNPSAGQSGQPDYILGDASCADSGSTQPTKDCSAVGGCLLLDFEFVYNIDGSNVPVRFVQRDCGVNKNQCISGDDLEALFEAQKASLSQSFPDGVTFVSADGGACTCIGNECNDGVISDMGGTAAPKDSAGTAASGPSPGTAAGTAAPKHSAGTTASGPSPGTAASGPSAGTAASGPSAGAGVITLSLLLTAFLFHYNAI